MSRELKFRAWSGEEMHSLIPTKDGTMGMLNDLFSEPDWIVMQFTGLKDQNGAEIYDGDIFENRAGIWLVEEEYGSFWANDEKGDRGRILLYLAVASMDGGSVIGNIHENPEIFES